MTERAERIELPGGLYMDADNEIHAADHEHLADVRFYPHCREIFAAAIRRPPASADVVGLVDDALLARAVFEQRRPTEALHKAQQDARAAVLDAFAVRDAEIERLNGQVTFWKGTAEDFSAWVDRERAEIERLKHQLHLAQSAAEDYDKDCIDMRYQRDAAQQYAASAEAELARLNGARVPEGRRFAELRSDGAFAHIASEAAAQAKSFQSRVHPWLIACFGETIASDRVERNHRFLEEALELVQSTGCTQSEAHQLVDYVYGRPMGDPHREVGGVMNTLAALCLAHGLDMHEAAEVELVRVWAKADQIRAKQAAKPKHSPLPEAAPAQASPSIAQAVRDIRAQQASPDALREAAQAVLDDAQLAGTLGRLKAEVSCGLLDNLRAALNQTGEA